MEGIIGKSAGIRVGNPNDDPSKIKPFVIVESPYMGLKGTRGVGPGTITYNVRYARAAIRDSILRGEAPFASHLLYTQDGILRDEIHEERELGMGLGWHIMRRANYVAIYTDLGWSSGMVRGYNAAMDAGKEQPMIRRLGGEWNETTAEKYVSIAQPDAVHTTVVNPDFPDTFWIEVDLAQGYGVKWKRTEAGIFHVEVVKSDRFVIGRYDDNAK